MYKHYYKKNKKGDVVAIGTDKYNVIDKSYIQFKTSKDGETLEALRDENGIFNYKESSKGNIELKTNSEKDTSENQLMISKKQKLESLGVTNQVAMELIDKLIDVLISKGTITVNDLGSDLKVIYETRKVIRDA